MSFWTMLMIRAHDGDGAAVSEAHINRRCVEEAAETIPGFLHGETMLSADDPALVCVMCTWEDEAAYKAWIGSPVRDKQTEDLAKMLADVDVSTALYRSIHTVTRPEKK
jgi:heme-degrading monooxygenase HmoA